MVHKTRVWLVGHKGALGAAITEALLECDAHVYSLTFDVREQEEVQKQYNSIYEPLDVLVYNVGVNRLDWSQDLDLDLAQTMMDVNCWGLLRVLQAANFTPQRVIVIGSDAARMPMRTSAAYCASKAALEMLVRVLAREWAASGKTFNIVAPGKIGDTAMTEGVESDAHRTRGWTDEMLSAYELGQIPAGRYGKAHEVAEVVAWLATDAPQYLNGETIYVNGARR